MKLLTQFVDPADAAAANARLHAAGIMTETGSVDPHIMQPSKTGTVRIGLWVVFDDQFDDAVMLLQDPDHVPKRRISRQQMNAASTAAGRQSRGRDRRSLYHLIGIVIGICLLGVVLLLASKGLY